MRFRDLIRFRLLTIIVIGISLGIRAPLPSPVAETPPINNATIEAAVFDFETGTTEGWEASTKAGEQGITMVSATTTDAFHGLYSLAMETHLDYSNVDLRQGMVYVMFPGDLDGHTMSAYIKCPAEAAGDVSHPNGMQFFVKDQAFRGQFSPWLNIGQDIPVEQWVHVQWAPSVTNPSDGYTDSGFDPGRVQIVGIKLGAGTGSGVSFQGTCYLDLVSLGRASLDVPPSDHRFNFDELTFERQRDKPFGYGPYWDTDPGWSAEAWHSDDVEVSEGALAITATFSLNAPYATQKGFIGIAHTPSLDINHKDNRVIRAQVRFDPYLGPERMLASFWVYDRRDAGPDCTGGDCKWYASVDTWVGGSVWNELVFDLDNPNHFLTDPARCPNCILPTEVTTTSLKNILKIGIQFYANEPYTGTVYLDNVTVGGRELPSTSLNTHFVKRDGSRLVLDGCTYRFAGNNVYYLFYKSHYMIDDVFDTMKRNGIRVVRTWGFGDGKAPYAADGDGLANGNEGSALQPEPGLYYEPTWRNMDYVLQAAGERGIRLIIPLVNHWSDRDVADGQNSFGGMAQYLEWCGTAITDTTVTHTVSPITNKATFYTDTCAIDLYQAYVRYVLERVNTLTGVPYKNDPTILAWELANEPRCQASDGCPGPDALRMWTESMSDYLKSLDSNHLVALGDEGFLNEAGSADPMRDGSAGVDWKSNLQIETIDLGTVHLYPDHWGKDLEWSTSWISDHIRIANEIGKPVIFEEYGICHKSADNLHFQGQCDNQFDRDQVYLDWTRLFETGAAGDAVWMIAGRVNGANEAHERIGDDYYYPNYDGFTFWEPIDIMSIIRMHASRMDAFCCYLPIVVK